MTLPIAIIGAGPAGLSCASVLSEAGRNVVIIDENIQPGGQYFRQLPQAYGSNSPHVPTDTARFRELSECLRRPNVRHIAGTTVWSATEPDCIAYAGAEESGRVKASAVVIATGAQDMPLPFPGWTLPGVISAGGCLNLLKGQGLVPEGRVLVAGNGPLVLVTAATLAKAGANIAAVVEAQPTGKLLRAVAQGIFKVPKVVAKAAGYRRAMLMSGVRLRSGWMISGAEGDSRVSRARIAPVGANGRPALDREISLNVDMVVTGYGIIPGSEPARIFGCEMSYDASMNGMVPLRTATLETSIKGVYAVGDGAGIGGVEVAIAEGRIAANAILECPAPSRERASYSRLDGFRRALNLAYRPATPLVAATPETIICRCEELRLSDLCESAELGQKSLNGVKTATRLGMGRCQGRNCLPAASNLLKSQGGALDGYPRARPPLRPVKLSQIASDRNARPVREPDEPLSTKSENKRD